MDVGFISLSPTSTSPICQVHFTYVANTKFNYGKLVAWQIWQVDFTCPPCSLCRVAKSKSTPPTCQITSPHCQVTKFTLASHCLHIESNLKVQIMSFISSLCPILVNDVWWNWLTKCIFVFQLIFWPWAIYVHGWNWLWWMNLTPLIGWISFVDHVQNAMTLIWMHAQWPNRMNLRYILTQSKFCRWNIIYSFISSMKWSFYY